MEAARQVVSTSPTEALPALAGPLSGSNDAVAAMRAAILSKLTYQVGKSRRTATDAEWYVATALAVRDRVLDAQNTSSSELPEKRVCYLSMEFLVGRRLPEAL